MNAELIIRQLTEIYGSQKGQKIYLTVMPGVLSDFRKMLSGAQPDEEIFEQYHLDDGKAFLELRGHRSRNGAEEINAAVIRK